MGTNLPNAYEGEFTECTKLYSDINAGKMLPEYITMNIFEQDDKSESYQLCKFAIESLNKNGNNMYKLEKKFDENLFDLSRLLYRLDTQVFTPI